MAFDKLKLVRTDSGMVANAPAHFDYNLKTDETITGAGYIPEDAGVKAGDIVTKNLITFSSAGLITAFVRTEYYAIADAAGKLTLTAFVVADSGSSDSD